MKIFEINSVSYGSTGRIMFQIADTVKKYGGVAYTSSSFTKSRGEIFSKNHFQIGSAVGKVVHIILAKLTGRHGCFSRIATYRLLKKIEKVNPDVIHLHNIHGWYLNWKMLFDYLKKANIPVIWTLHDCWSFTGHCPHFEAVGCEKWKSGCNACGLYKSYPGCFFDDSQFQYHYKKSCFTGVPNLTIVTPSHWLANLVKHSYLKEYKTVVINNGIDLNVFCPSPSDFRKKNGILKNQFMLLGVSLGWSIQKGIDVFIELANRLDEDKYKIVLVGTDDKLDRILPKNIISIHRTQNQQQLAEIYSAADLYVNPTREENFPTVNIESISCGTPVITFNTGGSPEIIDESCGKVVECDDIDGLESNIIDILNNNRYSTHACIKRASLFNKDDKFMEYIKIFKSNL